MAPTRPRENSATAAATEVVPGNSLDRDRGASPVARRPQPANWLRRRIFGISLEEATFARRGFRGGSNGARQQLERSGRTFLVGYNAALEVADPLALAQRLSAAEPELRGFAFEGAAMSLALRDLLTPWKRSRWRSFAEGPGASHAYMIHVGVGWALARLRRRVEPALARLDPLLGWLALDGYGFHQGYFHWPRYVEKQELPTELSGYSRRAFDQGLGRSLWFVDGADVSRIPATIGSFAPSRQADLWSGIGLASAYAGGSDCGALDALRQAAGPFRAHLAQGAAFAAKTRQRADNPARHTDQACEVLCRMPADAAAAITDTALEKLPFDGPQPAYEIWRERIRVSCSPAEAGA